MDEPKEWPELGKGGGGWSYDKPNGRVMLRFMLGTKRVKVYSTKSTAEAIAKRNAMIKEAERVTRLDDDARRALVTVEWLFDRWLEFHTGDQAPSTKDAYLFSRRLIAGNRKVWSMRASEVKIADVERLYLDLAPKYGESTLKKVRTHLGMMFDYGIRNEFCDRNPVRLSKFPGSVRKPKEATWLDDEQFDMMRAYLNDNRSVPHTALLIMMTSGMRPGEVLGLMWDAVHLDEGYVEVRRNLQRSNGGRVRTVVDQVKTPGSVRQVKLRPDVIAALYALRRERPFGLLFTYDDGQPLRFESINYYLEKACDRLGLPRVSPHKLRHTNGSRLLDKGMPPMQVAAHLGHSLEVLSSTYAHKMRNVMDTDVLD